MREAKVMQGGEGRARLVGETTRLDASELRALLKQSEGDAAAERFASGTPGTGLPQVELSEPEVSEPEVSEVEVPVPAPRSTRLRDFLLGGAISTCALIAWYCATQL